MRAKLAATALAMLVFSTLVIMAHPGQGTGNTAVYGDNYVPRYFRKDAVMQVNIELSEEDWAYLMENAAAEEFRTASVTVNGDKLDMVQIRTKGNSSLSSVARSDSNRYSFKVNFDGIIENQSLAGLTQLNLNNMFSDPSYMREYLSYEIFEEMGVPVPAYAYAAVHVNGEYFGLYLAVEGIQEPYLKRNFGTLTGDLYKSVGNTLQYNGPSPSDYTGLEVQSARKNADWAKLIAMLDALNNGGQIESCLDVDTALRYIAVSTALVNFDSYQGNFAHNYYLYEQDGVFTILPWDLNMSFGGFSFGGQTEEVYIDEPTQGALAARPLIAKLLENPDYLEKYHSYIRQVATEFLSGSYLEAETARLFTLISEYVRTDPTAFYSYHQFVQNISSSLTEEVTGDLAENSPANPGAMAGKGQGVGSIPGILEIAAEMSGSILGQLSGELPSTNNGNGMGGGMGPGGNRVGRDEGQLPGQAPNNPRQSGGFPGQLRPEGRADRQPPGAMPEGGRTGGRTEADTKFPSVLLVSGLVIGAGIIGLRRFSRRKYTFS